MLRRYFDAAKFGQLVDAEEAAVRKFAGLEQDHQIGAPGKRFPHARLARHAIESGGQIAGLLEFVARHIRPHARDSAECGAKAASICSRQASTTEAKIFV